MRPQERSSREATRTYATFAEISRITQQMQEAKIERKESDPRYISVVDQKKKEL